MTPIPSWTKFAILIVGVVNLSTQALAAQAGSRTTDRKPAEKIRMAFSHTLPLLDGAHLKATVVEVTYGPGESSPPHSHPCAVIGYVIRGRLRTEVKGQAEAVYTAGQSFYEARKGVHLVSSNASSKAPVKFLAYFVCDHDTPLTVAPMQTPATGDTP